MLTVGILTATIDKSLEKMTADCIFSFDGQADELIVVESGGEEDWVADISVRYKKSCGFTRGVNAILKNASNDYVLFVSNDIVLKDGNIHDLCIPDTVTSPDIFPHMESGFSGAMFCIPKSVLKKVGYLNEKMVQRYSDTEFGERLVAMGIPIKVIDSVKVDHKVDQTVHLFPKLTEDDKNQYINAKRASGWPKIS
jgi:GT2 family glycosyltransferase